MGSEFWRGMSEAAEASRHASDWQKAGINLNTKNFESNEWCEKIASDPDVDTEAGLPLPLKADTGPVMMSLVELIRFAPRDPKVRKLTVDAMHQFDELRAENARLREALKWIAREAPYRSIGIVQEKARDVLALEGKGT